MHGRELAAQEECRGEPHSRVADSRSSLTLEVRGVTDPSGLLGDGLGARSAQSIEFRERTVHLK